jgi:hypothetical protein
VLVAPPPAWHDVLVDVDVGIAADAVVEGPPPPPSAFVGAGVHAGVQVNIPVPTFEMHVGVGAVAQPVVVDRRREVIIVHDHGKRPRGRALGHRKHGGHW